MDTFAFPAAASSYDPFQQGSLSTDFPLEPLTGVGAVLRQSWRAYRKEFPTIAMLALIVFGPVEVLKNYFLHATNQQDNFQMVMRLDMWIGGILGALLCPAVIFAVMWRFRCGEEPEIGRSLRWGVRQWARTFGYRFLASVAIVIGFILLIIPGILIAVLFSLVSPVVAVEGDAQSSVLQRSRELAGKHGWKILGACTAAFVVYLGIAIGVGAFYGVLSYFGDHWILSAAVDCAMDIGFAYFDVLLLCLYLGIIARKEAPDLPPGSLGLSPTP